MTHDIYKKQINSFIKPKGNYKQLFMKNYDMYIYIYIFTHIFSSLETLKEEKSSSTRTTNQNVNKSEEFRRQAILSSIIFSQASISPKDGLKTYLNTMFHLTARSSIQECHNHLMKMMVKKEKSRLGRYRLHMLPNIYPPKACQHTLN